MPDFEQTIVDNHQQPPTKGGKLQHRVSSLDSYHRHVDNEAAAFDVADEAEAEAATKIQAGVRGFLTRHRCHEMKTAQVKAATKIQAGIRGHLTRKHLEQEGVGPKCAPGPMDRKISAPQLLHPKKSDVAAAKIQAGIRGYLTRKHLTKAGVAVKRRQSYYTDVQGRPKSLFDGGQEAGHRGLSQSQAPSSFSAASSDNDENAVVKIQAGIRGYLVRKHFQQRHPGEFQVVGAASGHRQRSVELYLPEDNDYNSSVGRQHARSSGDPHVDDAAAKIQAGVRGYLARQNLAKQKEAAVKIQSAFRGHHTRDTRAAAGH